MAALEQNVGRSFSASSGGRHNRPNTQNIATTAELLLAVHDVYCVRVGEQAECVKVMEAHRRRFETHRVIWDVYSFFVRRLPFVGRRILQAVLATVERHLGDVSFASFCQDPFGSSTTDSGMGKWLKP